MCPLSNLRKAPPPPFPRPLASASAREKPNFPSLSWRAISWKGSKYIALCVFLLLAGCSDACSSRTITMNSYFSQWIPIVEKREVRQIFSGRLAHPPTSVKESQQMIANAIPDHWHGVPLSSRESNQVATSPDERFANDLVKTKMRPLKEQINYAEPFCEQYEDSEFIHLFPKGTAAIGAAEMGTVINKKSGDWFVWSLP